MSLAKDNKNRIAVGGGIYNFMKHGSDDFNQSSIAYNFEYFSKKKGIWIYQAAFRLSWNN